MGERENEGKTYSVLSILLLGSTSSIFRTLFPFPFVFLPASVWPAPLKDSHSPPPCPPPAPVVFVLPEPPALEEEGFWPREEAGREEPGVDELTSMRSLEAIVSTGGGDLRLGSTYPFGGAKST